jgi:hypothetical protein
MAESLIGAVLLCVAAGAASVGVAMLPDNAQSPAAWGLPEKILILALVPVAYPFFLFSGARVGRSRIWILGAATVGGIAFGLWAVWPDKPLRSPYPLGAISAMATGWLVVAVVLRRRGVRVAAQRGPPECAHCGYSLAGLAPGAPCPECGKAASS